MSESPYDANFCYPLPASLESERVALTPFIPAEHAQLLIDEARPYPELFKYLPFGPFSDDSDFITNHFDPVMRDNDGNVLFAIYDKTRLAPPAQSDGGIVGPKGIFAGIIGCIKSSPANLVTEIGCIVILPAFQRTHVASNAVGILLHYALDLAPHGLGLRRVVWQANEFNAPSVRLAQRMGFVLEGILRWDRVLPEGRPGNGIDLRDGDPRAKCPGRNTAMLGLTWDDWEHEGREKVDKIMARVSVS